MIIIVFRNLHDMLIHDMQIETPFLHIYFDLWLTLWVRPWGNILTFSVQSFLPDIVEFYKALSIILRSSWDCVQYPNEKL